MADMLDTRNVMTGKDGQLYVTDETGKQYLMAEVDSFQAQINFTNTDIQPVGSYQSISVPVSYTVTLTVSEIVIRDDVMLKPIFTSLKSKKTPYFEFAGKVQNPQSKKYTREVFRDCIPDGSLDLMNFKPGEVVKRQWSFRVNGIPELQHYINA